MYNAGLILEGGGTRGTFTAGVLDFFMEKELETKLVIGVSAGACNALNFSSKQRGRTKACMIDYLRDGNYVGLKYLVQKKSIIDMDLIFDIFPNSEIPFDYDTYFNSKQKTYVAATDCLTGGLKLFREREKNKKRLMDMCRASSSLPVVTPVTYVNGRPYLDGGIADSIPIRSAISVGMEKNIVILTRQEGYRKSHDRRTERLSRMCYREYPRLVRAIERRADEYNKTLDYLEELKEQGKVYIIRPQMKVVGRLESNPDVLDEFYMHGYNYASEIYEDLIEYLERN